MVQPIITNQNLSKASSFSTYINLIAQIIQESKSWHKLHLLFQKMASKECIFFYFYHIFFLFLQFPSFKSQLLNNSTDMLSLLSFKDKITDPLQVLSSWNDSVSFCEWRGVTCSSTRPRVTILSLPSQKLGGSLSPAIANLTFLRIIDLRGNNFAGEIPPELGRLIRLESILLTQNQFNGEIPANLSQCTQLRVINMNYNNLTGKIPIELATLPNLTALHISANGLTGGIPPVLGNLTSLLNLSIAQNYLGGTIPDDLGRLVNLEIFQITNNNISGTIPPSIFNLSRITQFAVVFNNLVGSLPLSIGMNFPNLKQLLVGSNRFTGRIPPSLSNVSSLEIIDLPDNLFVGRVPLDFGRITNLQRLVVARNLFGRDEPLGLEFIDSLINCSNLQFLGIDDNYFSGPVPSAIANLSFTMNTLQLGANQLSGMIPPGITNLVNLNIFNVSWNKFEGPILDDIGKLINLRRLYLNGNRFSGSIPTSIGNLTELFELRLDGNKLENTIPANLGNVNKLQLLNLSDNNLRGSIPLEVFTLSSLTVSLNLARNSLSGNLVNVGNYVNLKEMDLSDNEFSGSIPDSLSQCLSLEHIYMQRNSLNGSIPWSLSALKGLQDFDLSENNLTGNIPSFFQDLVFLENLNLSYNHFQGEVPKNGVFANRSAVAVNGNSRLCGGNIVLELPVCNNEKVGRGNKSYIKIVIATVCGALGSALLLYVAITLMLRRSRKKSSTTFPSSDNWKSNYSYGELEKATSGFSTDNLVGTGSFAKVYKGEFSENGKCIAVKVLNLQEKKTSKVYMAECEALSNIKHRNLVKILGCCSVLDSEGRDFKAIVLEYMPNGSLDRLLHSSEMKEVDNVNVLQRLNIAIDVASALEYLHYFCPTPMAHCDLKPGNVLLDDDLCAHLGDFGLAKFLRKRTDERARAQNSSIGIRGSIGYVAPEYGLGGPASVWGDVYSFGILLLEMFTGKRPTDDLFKDELNIHNYAKTAVSNNVITDIIDPTLLHLKLGEEEKIKQCLLLIIQIGVSCSHGLPQDRMSMRDANRNLQWIKDTFFEC